MDGTGRAVEKQPEHPGRMLRQFMDDKGWNGDELAEITGYARTHLSGVLSGKVGVSPDMAVAFAAAFGNEAADWLKWNADYQLSLVETNASEVSAKASFYSQAPIRDMVKRGWIKDIKGDFAALEAELNRFYGGSIRAGISFPVATHRSETLDGLNAAEKAWCFRARQLARAVHVTEFQEDRLNAALKKLRQIAAYPTEIRRLSDTLAYYGIKLVIVEPIPGAKIDGASFWVEENPVIALSLRWDRIDAFWFVVFHEFFHIKNGDVFSVDVNLVREEEKGLITVAVADSDAEQRANEDAANALVPREQLESFIQRLAPLFSATRIVQFANRIQMHPGIIVGQLQHRRKIGYSAHRDFLIKIRDLATETSLTDGWGHGIGGGLTA